MSKPLNPAQLDALRAAPVGEELPNRVRIALALVGVKQGEVAESVGLTPQAMSAVVTGRSVVTVDSARTIAEYFGCSIEDLFPSREAA